MKRIILLMLFAVLILVACSKSNTQTAVDSALARDLNFAAQSDTLNFMSAQERDMAAARAMGTAPLQSHTRTRVIYRDRPVYRSSSPARRTIVQKNTKRDAIIGGVAGAAIGAVTSRDKVKGAVIGGVTGAVLGGVVGNNVDIRRR